MGTYWMLEIDSVAPYLKRREMIQSSLLLTYSTERCPLSRESCFHRNTSCKEDKTKRNNGPVRNGDRGTEQAFQARYISRVTSRRRWSDHPTWPQPPIYHPLLYTNPLASSSALQQCLFYNLISLNRCFLLCIFGTGTKPGNTPNRTIARFSTLLAFYS